MYCILYIYSIARFTFLSIS